MSLPIRFMNSSVTSAEADTEKRETTASQFFFQLILSTDLDGPRLPASSSTDLTESAGMSISNPEKARLKRMPFSIMAMAPLPLTSHPRSADRPSASTEPRYRQLRQTPGSSPAHLGQFATATYIAPSSTASAIITPKTTIAGSLSVITDFAGRSAISCLWCASRLWWRAQNGAPIPGTRRSGRSPYRPKPHCGSRWSVRRPTTTS